MKRAVFFGFLAAVLGLILTVDANSATVTSFTNATRNADNTYRVEEPTIVVVTAANGHNYAVTAFNRLTPSPCCSVVVGTSSEDLDTGTFVSAIPTNPYVNGQTSDPVLVVAGNRVYLFAVAFITIGGTPNQIAQWFSDNGGQSWTGPITIHENTVGSGAVFDDKPAAILSQNIHEPPYLGGGYVLHLAFIANDAAHTLPCGPDNHAVPTATIRFLTSTNWRMNTGQFACFTNDGSMIPSNTDPSAPQGWCEQASPGAAAGLENPLLFDVPYYSLHVGYQDFCNDRIWIALSPDHGASTWWDYQSIVDPPPAPNASFPQRGGLMGAGQVVCDSGGPRRCVSASFGMSGHYNVNSGTFGLAWHHRVKNSDAPDLYAEVMFTTYHPYLPNGWRRFGDSVPVQTGNHYSWLPAVEAISSGGFLVTYYDWDYGANPSTSPLMYRLYGTTLQGDGTVTSTSQLFDTVQTDPNSYITPINPSQMRLGEYQGLFFWNGLFHASTVYVRNGIGDIYHLRIAAP